MVQHNLFSAFVLVLFSVFVISCSGSGNDSPMKSAYTKACEEEAKYNKKACGCFFDFANDKLTEEEMLMSTFGEAYRKENGISTPELTFEETMESSSKTLALIGPAFKACG